jgi:hypothetical protein
MKFGIEFWLILFQEYINPKLFAVRYPPPRCFLHDFVFQHLRCTYVLICRIKLHYITSQFYSITTLCLNPDLQVL